MVNLKYARHNARMSQQALADVMKVSRSTIAMWETGASEPDNGALTNLSEIFKVPVDFFLGTGPFAAWSILADNLRGFFYYIPISAKDTQEFFGVDKENPEQNKLEDIIRLIHTTVDSIFEDGDGGLIVNLKETWRRRAAGQVLTEGEEQKTDVKVALFGGDGEVTDKMWEDVLQFVEFVKAKQREKRDGKP